MNAKTALTTASLTGALLLTGCAGMFGPTSTLGDEPSAPQLVENLPAEHSLRLEVTSDAPLPVTVRYGGEATSSESLFLDEWTYEVPQILTSAPWTVSAQGSHRTDITVTCRILKNDKVIDQSSATGKMALANCRTPWS